MSLNGSYNICKLLLIILEIKKRNFGNIYINYWINWKYWSSQLCSCKIIADYLELAMENEIKNVGSNIDAPFAWTRMIATIPIKDEASKERVERMKYVR